MTLIGPGMHQGKSKAQQSSCTLCVASNGQDASNRHSPRLALIYPPLPINAPAATFSWCLEIIAKAIDLQRISISSFRRAKPNESGRIESSR